MPSPRVAIIYGSPTDHDTMAQAGAMLERFDVLYDETFISPHRSPRTLQDWIAELEPRDIEVVIAGGSQPALPGIVASLVTMPVIGVPMRSGAVAGLDGLLAMTEMATGVPVATVGLGNAKNAAVLAVQILAVADPALRVKLSQFKDAFEAAAAGR
ncbi:MAG: 5-(carboxyamino)imidazole ribonucleotide mutase [Frankiaceae bacterium]